MMTVVVCIVVVYFVGYKNLLDLVKAVRSCVQSASKTLVAEVSTELNGGQNAK